MATLLLANAYYSSKDFDSALKVFKSVSLENKDLAAAALAGAGDSYVGKNQLGLAAESYQEASKKAENSVLKAQYLTHAADSYQATNQLQKASELYTKIIADYPGSTGLSTTILPCIAITSLNLQVKTTTMGFAFTELSKGS